MRAQELEVKLQNYWLTVAELRKAHHRHGKATRGGHSEGSRGSSSRA